MAEAAAETSENRAAILFLTTKRCETFTHWCSVQRCRPTARRSWVRVQIWGLSVWALHALPVVELSVDVWWMRVCLRVALR